MPNTGELVGILEEAKVLMHRYPGDYSWSSWIDDAQALEEIDGMIERLRMGEVPAHQLNVVFAATGPMQELAMQSGWSEEFLSLANRIDLALSETPP